MAVLEITVQQKEQHHWPIVLEERLPNTLVSHRIRGALRLDVEVLGKMSNPADYGQFLGEALFQGDIGQTFRNTLAQSTEILHLSLIIEATDLHPLAWEHLHAPTTDGGWAYLAQGQRTEFSLYFVNPAQLAPQNYLLGRRALVLRPQIANLPQSPPPVPVSIQTTPLLPPTPRTAPNFQPRPPAPSTSNSPKIENPTLFEITLQPQPQNSQSWPIVALEQGTQSLLPRRSEGQLNLDLNALKSASSATAYGKTLGEALFQDDIRDAFMRARDNASGRLRVLLFVEAPNLRALHWERLCTPPKWPFIARNQRTPFCLYLPSLTDRRFQPIGRRDLRALVLVANPKKLDDYGLDAFDAAGTTAGIKKALGDIPADFLVSGTDQLPTLDALSEAITNTPYTLLHIVAHGRYMKRKKETILFLSTDKDTADPISAADFLKTLENLQGARGLPHFAFLSTCESAMPEAEGGLGGLGQRLVRDLGMPAVVAMTAKVTISTATELGQKFYERLRNHGEIDYALAEAMVSLSKHSDLMVPALYSRLGGRPLFSDNLDRALTNTEISDGLTRLRDFLNDRAPILLPQFEQKAGQLQGLLGSQAKALSRERQRQREDVLDDIGQHCESILEINFKALALGENPPPYDTNCPFLGLRAFQPEHRPFFFGRDPLIAQLRHRLEHHPFLAVLGASGSGKSSLVMAGVVPELGGKMLYMTPGTEPLASLKRVLANAPAQAVLVIDQFEELFTLSPTDKRQAFIEAFLGLIRDAESGSEIKNQPSPNPSQREGRLMLGDLKIILTLRADFLGECAPYSSLAETIRQHMALIAPMNTEELRRAMEQQAATVGLRFEGGLSHQVLEEVQDEPGAMPLLQHLLQELWQRRHGRWLLDSEYRALGGIKQAIAHTADKVYQQASDLEKPVIRYIFTSLTRLDDEGEQRNTRQRVVFQNLVSNLKDPNINLKSINHQIAKLSSAEARLLMTSTNEAGQQTVEVAHEALLRHWPRLHQWLDEDRELLRLRQDIEKATTAWQKKPDDKDLLIHRGGRLAQIEALLKEGRLQNYLSTTAETYLQACLALRTDELQKAQERAEKLEKALIEAQYQANLALARQLAAQAINQLSVNNDLAWLLAYEAGKRAAVFETFDALRQVMTFPGRAALCLQSDGHKMKRAQWSHDERRILTGGTDAVIRLWDAETGALLAAFSDQRGETTQIQWSQDDSQFLSASADATIRIWDVETGANLHILREASPILQAWWSQDESRILSANIDGTARIWSAHTGEVIALFDGHRDQVTQARWNHDESRVLTASRDNTVRLWDAHSGSELLQVAGRAGLWNGDGSQFVSIPSDYSGSIYIWDAHSGERIRALNTPSMWWHMNRGLWHSKLNQILLISSGKAWVWSAESGDLLFEGTMPSGTAIDTWRGEAAWSPDEQHVLSSNNSGTIKMWHVQKGTESLTLHGHSNWINQLGWNKAGDRVLSASDDGTARVWLLGPDLELPRFDNGHPSRFNNYVLTVTQNEDDSVHIVDAESGAVISTLPDLPSWSIKGVIWSAAGDQILVIHSTHATTWHLQTGQSLGPELYGHTQRIARASWHNDNTRVLTLSEDNTIRVWDVRRGAEVIPAMTHTSDAEAAQAREDRVWLPEARWSEDGSLILTTSADTRTLRVWDSETGQLRQTFSEGKLSISPSGNYVLVANESGVTIQAAESGEILHILNIASGYCKRIVWHQGGQGLLITHPNFEASLWSVETGQKMQTLTGHQKAIQSASWNKDGSQVMTSGTDSTIRVWDTTTGQLAMPILRGHTNAVHSSTWNAAETHILSNSQDRTTRIWAADTGRELMKFGPYKRMPSAFWSADGRRIFISQFEGPLLQYYASMDDLLPVARQKISRPLTPAERERYLPDA